MSLCGNASVGFSTSSRSLSWYPGNSSTLRRCDRVNSRRLRQIIMLPKVPREFSVRANRWARETPCPSKSVSTIACRMCPSCSTNSSGFSLLLCRQSMLPVIPMARRAFLSLTPSTMIGLPFSDSWNKCSRIFSKRSSRMYAGARIVYGYLVSRSCCILCRSSGFLSNSFLAGSKISIKLLATAFLRSAGWILPSR